MIALLAVSAAACTDDLDPAWQLDHDRIIAVRASQPALQAGESATIDALLGKKGGKMSVASPEQATVVSPTSLASALQVQNGAWTVTAPSEDRLAAARTELSLKADEPVPLEIGVAYAGATLYATKRVLLGATGSNPALENVRIKEAAAPADGSEIVIGLLDKTLLSVDANDDDFDTVWLTSCGTMHDYDLPAAYLKIEDDDPTAGELALVVRDDNGGVSWRTWAIRAE